MNDKNLVEKAADAVADAAQSVSEGVKHAGQAVADAMTPQPIRAGDNVIVPSTDPSMPPLVMPAERKGRRKPPAGRRTGKKAVAARPAPAKRARAGAATARSESRKAAKKNRASNGSARKQRKVSASRTGGTTAMPGRKSKR